MHKQKQTVLLADFIIKLFIVMGISLFALVIFNGHIEYAILIFLVLSIFPLVSLVAYNTNSPGWIVFNFILSLITFGNIIGLILSIISLSGSNKQHVVYHDISPITNNNTNTNPYNMSKDNQTYIFTSLEDLENAYLENKISESKYVNTKEILLRRLNNKQ